MKKQLIILLSISFTFIAAGQVPYSLASLDSIPERGFSFELQGGYAGDQSVPFWMRSNQFGSVPLNGGSGSLLLRNFKNYQQRGEWQGREANVGSLWDWGYVLDGRANIGNDYELQLIEAHAKVKFAMFEARLGRSRDVMGLNGDTLLTSGNFAVSGNALGVPKFEISIPEYYRLPWFEGLFSFKGNFANGYMGRMEVNPVEFLSPTNNRNLPTFLHQKSLYGRLGRKDWKLQLYGGLNHQAQWGSESKVYGSRFDLNFLETLFYVTSGIPYGGRGTGIPRSKIGNHQGSIDVGASYDFENINVMVYRQNFYDVGALSKLANIADGLNGVTITNKNYSPTKSNAGWQKLLLEFFYSKDQAGYPWSKPTKSGDENYYNNFYYLEGWSYLSSGLGSPLIPPAHSVRPGQISDPRRFFISNRVAAWHLGYRGNVSNWLVSTKLTFAKHYGTFSTSVHGSSLGQIRNTPMYGIFEPVNQFSAIVQTERPLNNGLYVGGTIAVDQGKLLYNGVGAQVFVRKTIGY